MDGAVEIESGSSIEVTVGSFVSKTGGEFGSAAGGLAGGLEVIVIGTKGIVTVIQNARHHCQNVRSNKCAIFDFGSKIYDEQTHLLHSMI